MTNSTKLKKLFSQHFNSAVDVIVHAPGRVNLIGEHTDFNDGFVLPAAINYGTDIAGRKRDDNFVNVIALDWGNESVSFSLDDIQYDKKTLWVNYVAGTLKILRQSYPSLKGAELMVTGNVPQGAGLSSSASFEIAILKAYAELYDLPLDGIKAALIGQKSENEFVGCNCGIMDQLISAMGKQGHAMLLDCRDLSFKDVSIPETLSICIVNSNCKRDLVESEYNTRRTQCEQVAEYFDVKALRDVNENMLEQAKSNLDDTLYRRARHVVSENARTLAAVEALTNADTKLLSQLMHESHVSLQKDFEVSIPQIDILVAMMSEFLGEKGGVRMTGGGFGGCVVALVPNGLEHELITMVKQRYEAETGIVPSIYSTHTTQGAFRR